MALVGAALAAVGWASAAHVAEKWAEVVMADALAALVAAVDLVALVASAAVSTAAA